MFSNAAKEIVDTLCLYTLDFRNAASNKDLNCSRKLKGVGGYSPVGHVENGVIANTTDTAANNHDITDGGKGDEVGILNEVDGDSKEKKKRAPSVKVRLFKRLRSNSNSKASKLEFDADDFDVPVQKVIKVYLQHFL